VGGVGVHRNATHSLLEVFVRPRQVGTNLVGEVVDELRVRDPTGDGHLETEVQDFLRHEVGLTLCGYTLPSSRVDPLTRIEKLGTSCIHSLVEVGQPDCDHLTLLEVSACVYVDCITLAIQGSQCERVDGDRGEEVLRDVFSVPPHHSLEGSVLVVGDPPFGEVLDLIEPSSNQLDGRDTWPVSFAVFADVRSSMNSCWKSLGIDLNPWN
jgi:hypothetical protein